MNDLELSERIQNARLLLEQNLPDEAYELLRHIPQQALRREDLNQLLFQVYSALKDWASALRHARLLIALNPDEEEYTMMIAQCYLELGNSDMAERVLQKRAA